MKNLFLIFFKDETKMKEINNSKQFTLFVVDKEGVRLGISCIRWLVENEEPVLYLYEIQLEEQACRKGLGYRVSNINVKNFKTSLTSFFRMRLIFSSEAPAQPN